MIPLALIPNGRIGIFHGCSAERRHVCEHCPNRLD
jgi:hypothetical protein